jgi:hypothetical protein
MYELTIPGIRGGPDQQAIVGAILALDGNATVDFNWVTSKVSVSSSAELADISDMIAAIGYQIERIAKREQDQDQGAHHCDMCGD